MPIGVRSLNFSEKIQIFVSNEFLCLCLPSTDKQLIRHKRGVILKNIMPGIRKSAKNRLAQLSERTSRA